MCCSFLSLFLECGQQDYAFPVFQKILSSMNLFRWRPTNFGNFCTLSPIFWRNKGKANLPRRFHYFVRSLKHNWHFNFLYPVKVRYLPKAQVNSNNLDQTSGAQIRSRWIEKETVPSSRVLLFSNIFALLAKVWIYHQTAAKNTINKDSKLN